MIHPIHGFTVEHLQDLSDRASQNAAMKKDDDFFNAGRARMGPAPVGGITWADFNWEFQPTPGVNQMVGHTPGEQVKCKWLRHEDTKPRKGDWPTYQKMLEINPETSVHSLSVCIDTQGKHYAVIEDGVVTIHDNPCENTGKTSRTKQRRTWE